MLETEEFWENVQRSDGCWEWTGGLTMKGYGKLRHEGRSVLAHRFSYALHHGEIGEGLLVCHRCDNRRCVRPDHLFLGTQEENMLDMVAKGRTPKGSQNGSTKLTPDQVRRIRHRHAAGEGASALARAFGVDEKNIRCIVTRKTWAWLP